MTIKKVGDKHHYIPKFYLQQWANATGEVCEFSRPYKTVKPRMTNPDGTGYERGLYTFLNLPVQARDFIEKRLLQMADDQAAVALRRMVAGDMDFGGTTRSAWARFLMSLLHRSPERIVQLRNLVAEKYPRYLQDLRETFDIVKHPDDPRTYEEVRAVGIRDVEHVNIRLLEMVMDSQSVGSELINMVWGAIHFRRPSFPLLTSDRPTIMTNGIKYPNSHIVLPISPDRIFFAARTRQIAQEIDILCKRSDASARLNDIIVRQARRFVYSTDDRQLRFVENRLGQKIRCTPFE